MEITYKLECNDFLDYYLYNNLNNKFNKYKTWILRIVLGGSLALVGAVSFYNYSTLIPSLLFILAGILVFWLFPKIMQLDTKMELKTIIKDKYQNQFNVIWRTTFLNDKIIFSSEQLTTELETNRIICIKDLDKHIVFEVPDNKIFIIPKRSINNLALWNEWLSDWEENRK